MTNADVAADLRSLRDAQAAGRISIDAVGGAFERLTYELMNLRDGDEARLTSLVNEIEIARFTLRPENQPNAVADTLMRAQVLFDELAA